MRFCGIKLVALLACAILGNLIGLLIGWTAHMI